MLFLHRVPLVSVADPDMEVEMDEVGGSEVGFSVISEGFWWG
jgi:hypothetical protein